MTNLQWSALCAMALVTAFLVFVAMQPNTASPKAKQACVDAIMSNMGTSTAGYADRQAYDQRVANDCQGFDLPRR